MEHIWIFGFACGAGMVNPKVGWGVLLICTVAIQVWAILEKVSQ